MQTVLLAIALALPAQAPARDVGPFVRALWLVQRDGTAEAADPRNDARTKGTLAKALGKDGVMTAARISGLFESDVFAKLAGADGQLDPAKIRNALETAIPDSRKRLLPEVATHADFLTTSFDRIDDPHLAACEKLAAWIAEKYRPGHALDVTVVCTGNSRRSMFGATMGNIAAAYSGMPEIRFHSGGTAPTAFNPRTVAALKAIGVAVEPTGKEAPRGEPATANPIYRVRWGERGEPAMEAIEFSKLYTDASNPQRDFAALMVCGEADAACPYVKGAALRVSMPYLEPKIYDGSIYETAKYAERRDDVGALMLAVMMQARRRSGR